MQCAEKRSAPNDSKKKPTGKQSF
eukprot:COSAG02_NODE_11040_length_1806_cov_4.816052_1_plen_23_part_10